MGDRRDRRRLRLVETDTLEGVWRDNVKREDALLEAHPEWTIERVYGETGKKEDVTYVATDGTATISSRDLGEVLSLLERALASD